ncbi:chloride channel protein [Aurantimonas sp. VKM B-3413]|uniref:chloride channel protein n=1 Tax=Aurantimonas sp. VKM B-3413 TaxID=2779401 RepID=UPI001E2B1F47|nr:chloride channel protein [Aurantimonas sp. VKM B-3413]MCB8839626.1 chloride channel protein [Aurantimonas sp. VKM B-3413]
MSSVKSADAAAGAQSDDATGLVDRFMELLRQKLRSSELWFIALATLIGIIAGAMTVGLQDAAHGIQALLYGLSMSERLSTQLSLKPVQLLVLPAGGIALALFTYVVRARRRALVDSVEANALHGGQMSMKDSLIISGQTLISNGFGASVGLEAAYAQMGSGVASFVGRTMTVRRPDLRTLVGAGAGAGIAAAFGAPLAGAFYAFEIVMGAYTPSAIAPVAAACVAAVLTARGLGHHPYLIASGGSGPIDVSHYLLYVGLAALCAGLGIVLMRTISIVETLTKRARLPAWAKPAIGGALLMPLAFVTPQVLSSGHAALYLDISGGAPTKLVITVILAKCAASIVSLGFGFRGGLFFASLFVGSLFGQLYADTLFLVFGQVVVSTPHAALVGMAGLAVAVIGGPLTMAMLVLESTQNLALTGVVIVGSLVASTLVRVFFGYSFSTWRLHLRGETIRSARDVGWVRTLTAGRMMRRETRATPAKLTVAEFRRRFPLGSTSRVVLVDDFDRYQGIVVTPTAYADSVDTAAPISDLAVLSDTALRPEMDIVKVMAVFDAATADELAVVSADSKVLGLLSETYVRKRYAEEIEKNQRDLFGERQGS